MLVQYFLSYPAIQFIRRRGKKKELDSFDFMLFLGIPLSTGVFGFIGEKVLKDKSVIVPYFIPQLTLSVLGQCMFCITAFAV